MTCDYTSIAVYKTITKKGSYLLAPNYLSNFKKEDTISTYL